MTVAIIDYGSGNLRSAAKAFEYVGKAPVAITADPDVVGRADRLVWPGVGAFAECRSGLHALDGMVAAVPSNGRKFVVIHGGNILKTCRNYQSAIKLCKKLEKQTSRTTGTGTLPL